MCIRDRYETTDITAQSLTTTSIKDAAAKGTWKFSGWDKARMENIANDVTFVGTWTFAKDPEPKPQPPEPDPEPKPEPTPNPAPAPTPYPLPVPVPEVPAPTPAPAPAPEHKVPALEAPAPKAPTAPAEAPEPITQKHARMLPQTGDPMAISAVGEFGMMAGIVVASLAATLRRKRR